MARTKTFNQQEIIEKAQDLFWEKGYSATSIQDLVEHLNLNRSSIYNSFGDKHELFLKSLHNYKEAGYLNFVKKLNKEGSVKEIIRDLFDGVGQQCACENYKGCFLTNAAIELSNSNELVDDLFTDNRIRMQEAFIELLEKGKSNGELKADLDTQAISNYLYNAYIGLTALGTTKLESGEIENIISVTLSVLD